jgi:hypothetical protein
MQQRFLAFAGSVEPLLRDVPCPHCRHPRSCRRGRIPGSPTAAPDGDPLWFSLQPPLHTAGHTPAPQAASRRLLLAVVQDSSALLALRFDAAKALLPYADAASGAG